MNTIESILNDIDELLEDSWSLPLSGGRCVGVAERCAVYGFGACKSRDFCIRSNIFALFSWCAGPALCGSIFTGAAYSSV